MRTLTCRGVAANLSMRCSKTCAGWAWNGRKVLIAAGPRRLTPRASEDPIIGRLGASYEMADGYTHVPVHVETSRRRRRRRMTSMTNRFIRDAADPDPMPRPLLSPRVSTGVFAYPTGMRSVLRTENRAHKASSPDAISGTSWSGGAMTCPPISWRWWLMMLQ